MSYSQYYSDKTRDSFSQPGRQTQHLSLSTVHEDISSDPPPPPPHPLEAPVPSPQATREATISAAKCREVGKLFPIPVLPKMAKLAEPQPMKRIVPGYDMRTLRKQVDAMHNEVALRVDLQEKLYHQNEVMFTYVADLLRAQKKNARTMKTHVVSLQEELYTLQQERAVLVEKITEAQTTSEAIKNIELQQQGLEERIQEAQNARRAAVLAGQQKTQENKEIEARLKDSITQMQALHLQLEDLRNREAEERAEERADNFFRHHPAVLRAAFSRFRGALRSWRGMRLAGAALRSSRKRSLLRVYYVQWFKFLQIARLMTRNRRKKTEEYARLCLAKWKVYTALERFSHARRRRRQLSKYLGEWKELVKMKGLEERADNLFARLEYRRNLRHIFQNWKKGIIFLEWSSDELIEKERQARRHLLGRLLYQWREQAESARAELELRAERAARRCVLRFPFRLWGQLLRAAVLRKTLLASRGITNLRVHVRRRRLHRYRQREMSEEAPDLLLRGCLKRWQRRVLERKYFMHQTTPPPTIPSSHSLATSRFLFTPSSSAIHSSAHTKKEDMTTSSLPSVASRLIARGKRGVSHEEQFSYRLQQMHRRKGFSALLKWAHSACRMRSIRLGRNLAIRHAVLSTAKKFLTRWFFNTCLRNRALLEAQEQLKRKIFEHWCAFVPLEVRQKHLDRQVEHRFFLRQVAFQVSLVRRWRKAQDKARCCLTRRCHNEWRGQWARQLLWREKECQLAAKKSFALVELKVKELEDCGREKERLDKELAETREALARVQEALELRSQEMVDQEKVLQSTTEQVHQLETALGQSQTALSDVNEERKRLRLIEEVYEHDQDTIKQQQQAMQLEASYVLQSLQESTHELRQEAEQARTFVTQAQQQAGRSLEEQESLLQQALRESTGLQQRVTRKAQEVEEVEAERDGVLSAICRVKEQLQSVTDEMCQLDSDSDRGHGASSGSSGCGLSSSGSSTGSFFADIQSDIRHKESEVQALRLKTGQTEARVSSLREAIATRKEQISRANHVDEQRRLYRERQTMGSLYEDHSRYQQPPSSFSFSPSSSPATSSYKRHTDPYSYPTDGGRGSGGDRTRFNDSTGAEFEQGMYTSRGGSSGEEKDSSAFRLSHLSSPSPPPPPPRQSQSHSPYHSNGQSQSASGNARIGSRSPYSRSGSQERKSEASPHPQHQHQQSSSLSPGAQSYTLEERGWNTSPGQGAADLDRAMRAINSRLQARYQHK